MKALIIPLFTVVALTVIIYSALYWMRKDQIKSDNEIIELKKLADSLVLLQSQMDSMILVKEEIIAAQEFVIQSRELEVIRTQEVSNEYHRKYNSIKFAVLSDSGRLEEIRKLYKSWK